MLTCTVLEKITKRVSAIFDGDMIGTDNQIESTTIQQIVAKQTARFGDLEVTGKKYKVKVWWAVDCDEDEPTACTNSCTITPNPTENTECAEYELTTCFEKTWSTSEFQYETNTVSMEEVAATQMARKLKIMDEYLNQKAIAFLGANAGVNAYPNGYVINGTCTEIPAADWNGNIMGYMQLVKRYNKFSTNAIVTGSDKLWTSLWNASYVNSTNQNEMAKFKSIYPNIEWDGLGFLDAGIPDTTYVWNGPSIALVSKNWYTERIKTETVNGATTDMYSVASPTIPGVRYDVIHRMECDASVAGAIRYIHTWKMFFTGDFLIAPNTCATDKTGVLCFKCV